MTMAGFFPSHPSGSNVCHASLLTSQQTPLILGGTMFHSFVFEVAVVASRLNSKPLEVSSVAEKLFFTLHGSCDPAFTADDSWI